jgi:hypothetical protein
VLLGLLEKILNFLFIFRVFILADPVSTEIIVLYPTKKWGSLNYFFILLWIELAEGIIGSDWGDLR